MFNCIISARERLDEFLKGRTSRFGVVTTKEREDWAANIVEQIKNTLEDSDVFYDNMPDTVKER